MENLFGNEQDKLVSIQLQADQHGDKKFCTDLINKIEEISDSWGGMHVKGNLSKDDTASLIQSKHALIKYIKILIPKDKSD